MDELRDESLKQPRRTPEFVIGVGASAGGLQALEELFRHMPPLEEAAFVVIQHLSPDYKSMMPELLAKHTPLVVLPAHNGMEVEGGHIYVIPPKKSLTISKGRLVVTDLPEMRTLVLPIDVFFRSLASAYEDKAIGVILSGTGSDGTLGARELKGAGSMVVVQKPETARFDGMPRNAIATGVIDFVLPPEEIGERIVAYVKALQQPIPSPVEEAEPAVGDAVKGIFEALLAHAGIDFSVYRFATLLRRISKRMQLCRIEDLDRYAQFLRDSKTETEALYRDCLIGVTSFFRDREGFESLRGSAISSIVADVPMRGTIRVWSVGCSTGEESYSLAALLISELERADKGDVTLKVFATDVDPDAIEVASLGVYPMSAAMDIPGDMLSRFFQRDGETYRVSERLRRSVIFSRHNICKDPPFNRIDLIVCRNLLIYLKPETQKRVLEVFRFALRSEGFLFLGHSESLGDEATSYRTIDQRWKIFRRNPDAPRPSLTLVAPERSVVRSEPIEVPVRTESARMEHRILKRIMARYAPACAIVDGAMRVTMTFGEINRFLTLPVGQIELDIVNLAITELSAVLSTVTHKVVKARERVEYKGITIADDSSVRLVNIIAEPLESREGRELYIILFEEQRRTSADTDRRSTIQYDTSQHVQDLKSELQYTRETLQSTIEELETSNEELQATNEELLAANEELQSTNEELQSLNEELVTVNSEHQEKINELTTLNNDIENLLQNTKLGVIFLDKRMRVRRFTPAVRALVNMLPQDIGRPLEDLAFRVKTNDFLVRAQRVLETLVPQEVPVAGEDGREYLLAIVPYRTVDDIIQGIVLSFMDVTDKSKLARELSLLRRHPRIQPARILLVEDDAADRLIVRRSIESEKLNAVITEASTLAKAREALQGPLSLPDLILLDVLLPDGSGLTLLDELKRESRTKSIPVIILTGSADDADIRKSYEDQAACVLTKGERLDLGNLVRSLAGFWLSIVRLPAAES